MTSRHDALHRCIARLYNLIVIDTYYLINKKSYQWQVASMKKKKNSPRSLKFSVDMKLIERIRARRPDARQLLAIISRSYNYIKKLPLKGLKENYSKDNPELFEPVS